MDIGEAEEMQEEVPEWEAFAVGAEEWTAEALARRMEVESPGFGSGGLSSAVASGSGGGGGGLPSAVASGSGDVGVLWSRLPTAPGDPMRFRVAGPRGGAALVTARELPAANRINHWLRCPVSEFPDECPWDMNQDLWANLIIARQQIHLRESRESFIRWRNLRQVSR